MKTACSRVTAAIAVHSMRFPRPVRFDVAKETWRRKADFSKKVAAEREKRDPGDHAGRSSQWSAHENSEHNSKEEQTSHPSQRPLPLQVSLPPA
jgi:hypothetical protein